MAQLYNLTGIVVQGNAFGESDRLVTILSPERGLVRAIAPNARKHRSQLRGRTELLVVNDFLLLQGRSLDRISQAETQTSHPGLSRDFAKLAAGQYLAELTVHLGISDAPQVELYNLLLEHLRRLEQINVAKAEQITYVVAHLTQAIFHLLAIAGIAPQVQICCLTSQPVIANFADSRWRVGFSYHQGGIINLDRATDKPDQTLTALELDLLQHLGGKQLPDLRQWSAQQETFTLDTVWLRLERLLRDYIEHHINKSLKVATLIDTFAPLAF